MKQGRVLTAWVLLGLVLSIATAPTAAQGPLPTPGVQASPGKVPPAPRPAAAVVGRPSPVQEGAWRLGPQSPFQYQRHDAIFVPGPAPWGNKVYFMGGRTSASTELPDIWAFDPVTGIYTDTLADMPEDVSNYNANLIMDDGTGRGPAIYVIGSYDRDGCACNIRTVQRYYPQTNQAEALPTADNFPGSVGGQPLAGHGTAVVDDRIYVFGGWNSGVYPYFSNQTWVFDVLQPSGSRWTNLNLPMAVGRTYIQVAVLDGKIYAMGGISQYVGGDLVPTAAVEVLDTGNLTAGWQMLNPMPLPIAEGRAFGFDADTLGAEQLGGRIYTAGGGDWPDISREAMQYYVASDTWDQGFPDLVDRRVNVAGAYVPLYTPDPNDGLPGIWVFGGRSENGCDPPFGRTEYYPIPVAGECSILLVDDDWDQYAGEPFNGSGTTYYTSTLEALGYGYDRWDVWTQGDPALADLQNYDVVIWFTGYAWSGTITPSNEADLAAYLAGGGNLLLSSEDYLYDQGISPFARLYLGVEDAEMDTGETDLLGNSGDPIGHGLGPYNLTTPTSWPLDDPELYTDRVAPGTGVGAPFSFQASAADNSTDLDAGLWRTVFLAWPLEGLGNLGDRSVVLERALDWLCPAQRGPSMALLPAGQEDSGPLGAGVTYTLYIANDLGHAETFEVGYAWGGWPIYGPAAVGPVPARSMASFIVTVTVPPQSGCGDVGVNWLFAAATSNPTIYSDTAYLRTHASPVGNGDLSGTIYDANTGLGIPGAHIYLELGAFYTETWAGNSGLYTLTALPACVTYSGGAQASHYQPTAFDLFVLPGPNVLDLYLSAPWPQLEPDAVSITLTEGSAAVFTATLANAGSADLHYTLTESLPWLGVAPPAGTVAPGGSAEIALLFDPAGLPPDACYTGTLALGYDDPYVGQEDLPLAMCVEAACDGIAGVNLAWSPSQPLVGQIVAFSATVAGTPTLPITYTWDFGDGGIWSGSIPLAEHTYTATGAYSVTVIAANACSQAAAADVINVQPLRWTIYLPVVAKGAAPGPAFWQSPKPGFLR